MQQFYMVWCNGTAGIRMQHVTKNEATTEAERLARKEPGQEFYVLKAITMSKSLKPVETIQLESLPY